MYFLAMAISDSTESMVCSVCRFPLSEAIIDGVHGFVHSNDVNVDHMPDPTPERESTSSRASCDFCSEPMDYHGAWVVMTKPITEGQPGGFTIELSPDWGACLTCAELIKAKRWQRLTERSVDCMLTKHPGFSRKMLMRELTHLHGQVRNGFISLEWDPS